MSKRETILIVNNEKADINLLTEPFREDYEIQVAQSDEQALQLARSDSPPDLVLLMAIRSDIDASRLCKNMKSEPQFSGAPIMFFLMSNDPAAQEKAIEAGADDCIFRSDAPALTKLRVSNQLRLARDTHKADFVKHQIEKSNYQQKQLLGSISSILIGLGHDGKIALWNRSAERLFGLHEKEVIGKRLEELSMSWVESLNEPIKECRSNMRVIRTDAISYSRSDDTHGFLGFNITPIIDKESDRLGVMIVGADITKKMDMEKQLLHSQKMESIGQLAAGIAHEINTPLQYVNSNITFLSDAFGELTATMAEIKQLVESGAENGQNTALAEKFTAIMEAADLEYLMEDIPEAIVQSQEGASRVSKIVLAMKDFSHGSDVKAEADLNRAIESTITVAQSEWKHVAKMVTELDPELPLVPCLLSEFNQVILNMIVNASHAIADAIAVSEDNMGVITISTRQVENGVEVRVRDTGTGIPEAVKNRIFDPFFTTKGVGKGTGQGLTIAHATITKKHGGTIDVESAPDEGTDFIITLPLDSAA